MARAGNLTFDVDADGTILERSLRRIGRAAGITGANEFETAFGRRFNQSGNTFAARAEALGKRIGDALGRGFSRVVGPVDRLNERVSVLTTRFDRFNRTAVRPYIFNDLSNLLAKGKDSLKDFGDGADGAGASIRKLGDDTENSGRLLKSHVARTIALWTGVTLAIGQATATLGSGLSASLVAVIGSLAVAIVGAAGLAGAAIAGFAVQVTLAVSALQQMKDVVPGFQGTLDNLSAAWENAGKAVAAVWGPSVMSFLDQITAMLNNPALLEGMGKSLASITDSFTAVLQGPGFSALMSALETTIPDALASLGSGFASIAGGLASVFAAAAPTLAVFADQFNTFWGDWETKMAEMAADGRLQEFFALALESINSVMGVVGALGGALMNLFIQAAPFGNQILDMITGLLDEWNNWMSSIEGQQALQTWFENGVVIFEALMDFLGDVGQLFADLVTPESVERLVRFLDGLGEFLPIAGQILDFFGRLDILNVFVGILQMVGEFLAPLMPSLLEFADVLGGALVDAAAEFGPLLGDMAQKLLPLIDFVLILAAEALPVLIDIISTAIGYVTEITEAIFGAEAGTKEYKEAVEIMGQIVGGVFTVLGAVITSIMDFVSGTIKAVAQLLRGDFTGAFETVGETGEKIMGDLGIDVGELKNFFEDALRNIGNFLRDAGGAVRDFGSTVSGIFDGIIGWVSDAVDWFWSLFGAANSASGAVSGASGAGGGGGGRGALRQATGGLHTSMRHVIVGEAGPEAIVPLRRNLAQVDPAVRWLSAIAQGKYASGGLINGGGGGGMVVSPGAIVVQEAGDSRRTANDVLTRLAEYANG